MKNRLEKKLFLRKKTVSNLDQKEMNKMKGGTTTFNITCFCYTEHKSCSLGVNCCPPAEKLDNQTGYYC